MLCERKNTSYYFYLYLISIYGIRIAVKNIVLKLLPGQWFLFVVDILDKKVFPENENKNLYILLPENFDTSIIFF